MHAVLHCFPFYISIIMLLIVSALYNLYKPNINQSKISSILRTYKIIGNDKVIIIIKYIAIVQLRSSTDLLR